MHVACRCVICCRLEEMEPCGARTRRDGYLTDGCVAAGLLMTGYSGRERRHLAIASRRAAIAAYGGDMPLPRRCRRQIGPAGARRREPSPAVPKATFIQRSPPPKNFGEPARISASLSGMSPRKSGSQLTHRWREMDSNHRFRARRNREILVSRWSSTDLVWLRPPEGPMVR